MKSKTTVSFIAVLLAVIGTIVLVASRSAAVEAAYPAENAWRLWRTEGWARLKGWFHSGAVGAENLRLKREVSALAMLRGDVARLEAENARLRRALDYRARAPEEWLPAAVLSADGGAAAVHDVVRVDKGSLAGVRKGALVMVPEGLVGKVTGVTPHTAEVTLATDPKLMIACEIEVEGARGRSGVLTGGSPELLQVSYVMGAGRTLPYARVFTSGRGGVFPRGIEIGTLQYLTNGVRGVEGKVLPNVGYATLEDVFIRRAK